MTAEQSEIRIQFLAQRKLGIGGSDVASLLAEDAEVQYGCKRRLWLEKSNVPADLPDSQNGPMMLGSILEPYLRQKYTEHTGRPAKEVKQQLIHPKYPFLRVNLDGVVKMEDGRVAAQEIKCVGGQMYYIMKRTGPPIDYVLQLQHGMLVANLPMGVFTIGSPEKFADAPLNWDVEPNSDIHEAIIARGSEFWPTVGDESRIPERLEPDDRRCQDCRWRISCQGNALINIGPAQELEMDESLRPLLAEYDERKQLFTEAESLVEETKEHVKSVIGDRHGVCVAWPGRDKPRPIYFRQQEGRSMVNTEAMAKQYEEMRAKLVKLEAQIRNDFDVRHITQELIDLMAWQPAPPASFFNYRGKPSRPLRIF